MRQGIAAVRQAGNAWDVAIALGDLADVRHALGDDAAARRHYAESLELWLELGDERGVAQGLEGFAILASADVATGARGPPDRRCPRDPRTDHRAELAESAGSPGAGCW